MALFGNKPQQQRKRPVPNAQERAQRAGTDKRTYGDLLYRCRRCGYEGRMENIPDCDKVAYALLNGNDSHIFMTTNFYLDETTRTLYKECMHHECAPGQYGYMEIIGVDIKGQTHLADKYKRQSPSSGNYNPNDEISLDDMDLQ